MCIPRIFRWPTPWLWGALIVFFAVQSDNFGEVVALTCVVVMVASVLHYRRERRGEGRAEVRQGGARDLDQRLVEIERRMTDTQDVMIALSEKMDRWEEAKPRVD